MTLLAIDPGRSYKGEGTIGYCLFTDQGDEIERGSLSFEDLCQKVHVRDDGYGDEPWLDFGHRPVDEIVIEDFVNDPKSARGGQRNGTSECIGAVEILALQAGAPFTRQRNTILPVAKKHSGYVDTHKHLPHQDSAFLHGYYYLVSKGVLQPKGLADTLETR